MEKIKPIKAKATKTYAVYFRDPALILALEAALKPYQPFSVLMCELMEEALEARKLKAPK